MMRMLQRLEMRSPLFWGCVGCALVLLICVVSYWTAPEPMILYLLPVLLTARYGDLKSGLVVSFVSVSTWMGVDLWRHAMHAHWHLTYWSVAERMAIFTFCAVTVTRLAAMQRQKEQLTEFIVHDLRTPLTSILGGLQTLRLLASERHDELEIELADVALIGGNQLLTLVNSLLDTGRLTGSGMPLHRCAISAVDVAGAASAQATLWANRTSISIQIQCDAGDTRVMADPALIERVLVNLLGNAIKFSPPCSVITVCISPFQSNQLAFRVTDTGRGMSEREAARVFGKYAQIGVQEHALGGNGIGLTFCRLAVEAHKGRIWIESKPGHGTTVMFTLPATGSQTAATSEYLALQS